MINPNTPELNVDPDHPGNADFTSFDLTVTDLDYIPVPGSDISYVIPSTAVTVTAPSELALGEDYNASVVVAIPADVRAGVYRGTITVTGLPGTPGTPTDEFELEVVVGAIDDIDITEPSVSATTDHGTSVWTTPFTVWSTDAANNPDAYDGPGNTTLYGVTFSSTDLKFGTYTIPAANVEFVPPTIDSIRPATSRTVYAKVNVPYGVHNGVYTGLATAINNTGTTSDTVRINITVNPYYDLDIVDNEQNLFSNTMHLSGPMGTTRQGSFRMVNPNSAELNVDPDQYGNADFTSFTCSIDTLRYIPFGGEDILYYIPPSAISVTWPSGLGSGESYDASTQVMIPMNTYSGVYRGWVRLTGIPGTPGTPTDSFVLQVSVGPLDDIDITEPSVSATTNHGTTVWTTPFTVWSTDATHNPDAYDGPGNTTLYGITFAAQDLRAGNRIIPAANIEFMPSGIDSIQPAESWEVEARVNVPYGTYATTYSGLATATNATGTTSDTVRIYVTVLPSYDIDISDNTGNLVQNWMTLSVTPLPNVNYDSAYFVAINPNNPDLNVDPDQFGNFDLTNVRWSVDDLFHLTDPLAYIPKESVMVFMPTPDFIASGASKFYEVKVSVPVWQLAGDYNTWLKVYELSEEPDDQGGILTADSFQLKVIVLPLEDIDIIENQISNTVNTADTLLYIGQYTVVNPIPEYNPDPDDPSNINLNNLRFTCENLRGVAPNEARYIPAENIFVEIVGSSSGPTPVLGSYIAELPLGESQDVKVWASVPRGTYGTTYRGEMRVIDDDGYPSDVIAVEITVNKYYDLDISDNEQNLVSNKMSVAGAMGSIHQRYFRLINPNTQQLNVDPDIFGNADFTGFTYVVDTLRYIPFGSSADILYYIPPSAVTVTVPQGLASGDAVSARVQVSIPMNTFTGTYRGRVRVTGIPTLDTHTDTFTLEVVVGPFDDIDIDSSMVHATTNHGTTVNTTSFRVYSTDAAVNPDAYDGPGNTTLYGVTFTSQDLRSGDLYIPAENVQFVPTMIESIKPAQSYAVYARVNVPYGTFATTYSGIATAINNTGTTSDTVRIFVTVNPYYDLDISDNEQNLSNNKMALSGPMGAVRQGYFRMINPNTPDLNVDPDQFGNAHFTSFTSTVDTLKYIPFGDEDILYYIPPSAVTVTLPAGLNSGTFADARVLVNIPMNTFSGVYRAKVTVRGVPSLNTYSDTFMLEVFVGPLDDIDITEPAVSGTGNHGTVVNASNFTVWSTDADEGHNPDAYDGPGNTTLYGITFSSQDLRYGNYIIPGANVSFAPVTIESLPPGTSRTVQAQVTVPYGVHNGLYTGLATATNNTGTTSDTVRINITVNPYYDLDIADNQQNLVANKLNLSGPMGAVRLGRFRMINPNSAELNVDPDQFGNADFTNFSYSIDTLKYVPFGDEDILYYIPPSAVTLTLPVEGGIVSGNFFDATATVNIPMNTFAGTYRGKVRITGTPGEPGTPTDTFTLEVVVGPLDDLDIDSSVVHATTNHGATVNTTSFRVYSTDAAVNPDAYDGPGNTTLYGVTFSSADLRFGNLVIPASNVAFVPVTIDSIKPAASYPVYARVNVPYGTHNGTYTGLATAVNNTATTSDTVRISVLVNAYYDLDIADNQQNLVSNKMNLAGPMGATRQGYFRMVNPFNAEMNIDPDQFGNADFTGFTYSVDTLRYVPFGDEDIMTIIPPSAVSLTLPTGLVSGAMYDAKVTVNIPMNTLTGIYRGYVTVNGTPGEPGTPTDVFMLEVNVGPLEDLDITEASVSATGNHGTMVTTTPFTVWSTDAGEGHNPDPDGPGNITLYGINFVAADLRQGTNVIPSANIQFTPASIASLYPGTSAQVRANVTIPYGTFTGTYSGLVVAQNNSGSTTDTVRIYVTVNPAYDLDIADNMAGLVLNKMSLNLVPNFSSTNQFLLMNPDRPSNNYDPDPYGNANLTGLIYDVSPILYSADNYELEGGYISFSNNPEALAWGEGVNVSVTANIKPLQPYATYYGTVKVYKLIAEQSILADSFTLEVVVGPRDIFSMSDTITIFGYAGTLADTSFFVTNTGNKTIERIELFAMTDFFSAGGVRIPKEQLAFTPPIIVDSMRIGESTEVVARVDIPRATLPTVYIAKAKAMQQSGDPAKNFIIRLNVVYQPDISEDIVFSDNPVTGAYVDIACLGSEPKLTLMNMAAEIVQTANSKDMTNGVYRWNLTNSKGKPIASGMYVAVLQTKIDGKDKVFTKKLLIVK